MSTIEAFHDATVNQPLELRCEVNSHPEEQQYLEARSPGSSHIISSNSENSAFQSRFAHKPSNACWLSTVMAWEVSRETNRSHSFFNPDAHSTPQIPFEPVHFTSRNPLLEDLPSISDEFPSPCYSHASPDPSETSHFSASTPGFTLVGTLGCGAYGKVLLGHLGKRLGTRDLHAIKVFRKGDMNRYGAEEVKRELRTLRWIADTTKSHNTSNRDVLFLQKMTRSFQNERYVFIVLEYHTVSLENSEIVRRLRLKASPSPSSLPLDSSPSYSQNDARDPMVNFRLLAAELVLALRFLHGHGIVHQDVKPGNVMVSAEGHIVLSDFGASIALPFSLDYDFPVGYSAHISIGKTYHPVVLQGNDIVTFTPSYAAPELLRRNDADLVIYDERVDWFSLGVLLYELATGSLPFQAEYSTRNPKIRRSVDDFSLAFGHPEKLSHAINKCGPDPSLRCTNALESFLKALLAHQASDRLSGEDVKLHPFFDPVSAIWDEISDMIHPPLPYPPLSPIDSDVSLSMNPGASCGPHDSTTEIPLVDELYNEAGLRVTWPKARNDEDNGYKVIAKDADEELRSIGEHVVPILNSAGLSNKHIPDNHHSTVFLPNSYTFHTIEDVSEIQPFPSTASIMFMEKDELKGKLLPATGFGCHSSPPDTVPKHSDPRMPPPKRVTRRLAPSSCSAQDSGVDLSYDPDISSCVEADMSYSVDFAEVLSITSNKRTVSDHYEVREQAAISNIKPALECLPFQCSPNQRRLSTVTLPQPPFPDSIFPSTNSSKASTRRDTLAHKHDEKPASAKNVHLSAPPTKRIHYVHPSIPPVSRFNRSRPSFPVAISPSVTTHRSRRRSLPTTYRQVETEDYRSTQRNSYAGQSASHNLPNEFGMQSSSRSRRMSESWTLEEELTISVLNAMEFPRLDYGLRDGGGGTHGSINRRETPTSRTRRAALSVFGSIRRRSGGQDRAPASIEPPLGRKRRHSVLMKRQQKSTLSSERTPPPSPKRTFGNFLRKLRQLSGLGL